MRRTVTTNVIRATPNSSMRGSAEPNGGTRAEVSWTLTPKGEVTYVTLAARLMRVSTLDRLLLAVGGRAWLARRFASILERLAEQVHGDFARASTLSPAGAPEPV